MSARWVDGWGVRGLDALCAMEMAAGFPQAPPARAADYAERLAQFQSVLAQLGPLVKAAELAGYSTPFLINGELILKDERFRQPS